MPCHPLRESLGPEPPKHRWNLVRYWEIEPMFGPAPWDRASEVSPHSACERCGSAVRATRIVCAGCLRVAESVQRKLSAERSRFTDPKLEKKPAKPAGPNLTRRQRRQILYSARTHKDDPAVKEWVAGLGLAVA